MICLQTTKILLIALLGFLSFQANAQMITGVWKGKIDKKQVEVKIIQNGDSLTGTSYYGSANNYRRYSIKGYFDANANSVVWWDDQLIEEKGNTVKGKGMIPHMSVADFNCPGLGEMYLDGKSAPKENPNEIKGPVDLTKVEASSFPDEWDFIIDNFTVGTNNKETIDSIDKIAQSPAPPEENIAVVKVPEPELPKKKQGMVAIMMPGEKIPEKIETEPKPLTIEEKFVSRKKVFTTEIPVEGDSIELRFYDNAEVDGDSISLFLNDILIFNHIRLTDRAYTIKLSVSDLLDTNELTMVAENLGSIPPNTSYMVALAGDKRYEAKLASTENSSAVIRLRKQ